MSINSPMIRIESPSRDQMNCSFPIMYNYKYLIVPTNIVDLYNGTTRPVCTETGGDDELKLGLCALGGSLTGWR